MAWSHRLQRRSARPLRGHEHAETKMRHRRTRSFPTPTAALSSSTPWRGIRSTARLGGRHGRILPLPGYAVGHPSNSLIEAAADLVPLRPLAVADGTEPIADDELLYRRVPVSTGWCFSEGKPLGSSVHRAQLHDPTGLSVSRDKYCSSQQAARGRAGKSYYLAVLRASESQAKGMRLYHASAARRSGARRVAGLEFRKSQGE